MKKRDLAGVLPPLHKHLKDLSPKSPHLFGGKAAIVLLSCRCCHRHHDSGAAATLADPERPMPSFC